MTKAPTKAALKAAEVLENKRVAYIKRVRKGDVVERWNTHQIWNVSKLGNEFPQWPTRLMKR